jgi:hypothetical protein
MSEINIEVAGGSSVRLPTAGKYCDRNIVVTATGGGGADFTELERKLSNGFTDYSYYLYNKQKMTEVPVEILQHTAVGTNFSYMLQYCYGLTTFPQFDTSKGSNFTSMVQGCNKLTTAPQLDTSKGTIFSSMYQGCSKLVTIGGIDFTSAAIITSVLNGCSALENITFNGVTKITGLDLSYCKKLTHDSLMSAINALYDWAANGGTSTYKLTLGSTNLDKLTDAEKAIATQKGWTLA